MKLSDAMVLGEVSIPRNNGSMWFGGDKWGDCGCAVGRAYLAAGGKDPMTYLFNFNDLWPWLTESITGGISGMFLNVIEGGISMDSIYEHVRSIEPDCETCCRFTCTCAKSAAVPESQEAVCQL